MSMRESRYWSRSGGDTGYPLRWWEVIFCIIGWCVIAAIGIGICMLPVIWMEKCSP